jgi:hypothetical protein
MFIELYLFSLFGRIGTGGWRTGARTAATAFQIDRRVDGSFELPVHLSPYEKDTYGDYNPYHNGIPHNNLLGD